MSATITKVITSDKPVIKTVTTGGDIQTTARTTPVVKVPLETYDYNDLLNLPKLDGKTIQGEMFEQDPTVPEWAKEEQKPTYTAEEVKAVGQEDAIPLEDLAELFN